MKKGFTLLELIFVIVIIGIMAGIGSSAFSPKYLRNDADFIVAKIKEAQFLGIGHEHLNFGGASSGVDYKSGCIYLNDTNLSESASNPNETSYKIHSTFRGWLSEKIICFDSKGRPHVGDFNGTLIQEQKKLILSYGDKNVSIKLEPMTGYVIIKY